MIAAPDLPLCVGQESTIWAAAAIAKLHALCALLAANPANLDAHLGQVVRGFVAEAPRPQPEAECAARQRIVYADLKSKTDLASLKVRYGDIAPSLVGRGIGLASSSPLDAILYRISFPRISSAPLILRHGQASKVWVATGANNKFKCQGEGTTPLDALTAML